MTPEDKDIKHVIILDEGKKAENADVDEALLLLQELDEYTGGEDRTQTDEEEETEQEKQSAGIRRRRRVSAGHKRLIFALMVSLLILTAVLILAAVDLDTGYREPVSIYEKYLNTRDTDGEELSRAYANGLAKHQFKALRDAQHKLPGYEDMLLASRQANMDAYDETCSLYGEDRRYSVTIDEAVPLSEGELLVLTADFEGIVRDLAVSSYAGSSDPALRDALSELTDKVLKARITRGYRLYCTRNIQGSSDDGPVSRIEKCEFTVVRLGGHWIMWDKIYDIFRMSF